MGVGSFSIFLIRSSNETFFLMIRRPPRYTPIHSSAASDVYKRQDNGKVLGAHIFGLHAADLIQEISNAISRNQDVIELSKEVHTHPTLSEVVEVAYKQAASQIK